MLGEISFTQRVILSQSLETRSERHLMYHGCLAKGALTPMMSDLYLIYDSRINCVFFNFFFFTVPVVLKSQASDKEHHEGGERETETEREWG